MAEQHQSTNCHCGHNLLRVDDDLAPIVPEFRGIWCLECRVQADDDCSPTIDGLAQVAEAHGLADLATF